MILCRTHAGYEALQIHVYSSALGQIVSLFAFCLFKKCVSLNLINVDIK